MTTADRETLSDLRTAIEEITDEIAGTRDEIKEIREQFARDLAELQDRLAGLREQKAWRISAIDHLKTK
jgi:predicted  nucleic acid-binding Zn-ribbon protein